MGSLELTEPSGANDVSGDTQDRQISVAANYRKNMLSKMAQRRESDRVQNSLIFGTNKKSLTDLKNKAPQHLLEMFKWNSGSSKKEQNTAEYDSNVSGASPNINKTVSGEQKIEDDDKELPKIVV